MNERDVPTTHNMQCSFLIRKWLRSRVNSNFIFTGTTSHTRTYAHSFTRSLARSLTHLMHVHDTQNISDGGKHPPSYYLDQLIQHLDAIEKQKKKKAKTKKLPNGVEPAGGLLRGLEISLRTNSLAWVKEFIGYQFPGRPISRHGGLDILIDYFKNMDEEGRKDNHEHLCVMALR